MLAVVAVLEDSPPIKIVGAVRSRAVHDQPFVAVKPVAPFRVTTTVQEFAPSVKVPAEAPPVDDETEQPEVVNFVPLDIGAGCCTRPCRIVLVMVDAPSVT